MTKPGAKEKSQSRGHTLAIAKEWLGQHDLGETVLEISYDEKKLTIQATSPTDSK